MSFIAVLAILYLVFEDFRRPTPKSPVQPGLPPIVRGKSKGRPVYENLDGRP